MEVEVLANGGIREPMYATEKKTLAILRVAVDFTFGSVVNIPTKEKTIVKALEVGINWPLIRNTTHQNAMAYYA